MRTNFLTLSAAAGLSILVAVAALGGCNSENPVTPSPSTALVRITASGLSVTEVSVGLGGSVAFHNFTSVNHQIQSDPHPGHTDCPPVNQVGLVTPGRPRRPGR